MEHANSSATQRQEQHQQLQQHHQEQQQQHEHQQQFCLRWHNHQTSLLSTLPILLDQSHLTDVTISAEGRNLRAHRVVLSACSTFFLELFRALDTTNHPIIILPGASFAAIVALLTFMYSGEVNVYEEQIPMLLNLAETLGIKGLADVQNNLQKSSKRQSDPLEHPRKDEPTEAAPSPTPPTPPPPTPTCGATPHFPMLPIPTSLHSLATPLLSSKLPTPLESFFLKSLQFYPNLLPQPLNFSQTALNKTTELLAKYQQQCSLYQSALGGLTAKDFLPALHGEETNQNLNDETYGGAKRLCLAEKKQPQTGLQQQQLSQQQAKDTKRIDKIVETLRSVGSKTPGGEEHVASTNTTLQQHQHLATHLSPPAQLNLKTGACNYTAALPTHLHAKSPLYAATAATSQQSQLQQQQQRQQHAAYLASDDQVAKLQQHIDQYAASCSRDVATAVSLTSNAAGGGAGSGEGGTAIKKEANVASMSTSTATPASPQGKAPSNSKLYATCFICHKQLSNQYNLRVHLETHQNVRYACNVCSHVSRSKDALRKHVSYRHPGAPSPCETDARRKRAAKVLNSSPSSATTSTTVSAAATAPMPSAMCSTPTSPSTGAVLPFQLNTGGGGTPTSGNIDNEMHMAAHLSSAAYMFLPQHFNLAAQRAQQHMQNITPTSSASAPATPSSVFDFNIATPTPANNGANNNNIDSGNIKNEHLSPLALNSASPSLQQQQQQDNGNAAVLAALRSSPSVTP